MADHSLSLDEQFARESVDVGRTLGKAPTLQRNLRHDLVGEVVQHPGIRPHRGREAAGVAGEVGHGVVEAGHYVAHGLMEASPAAATAGMVAIPVGITAQAVVTGFAVASASSSKEIATELLGLFNDVRAGALKGECQSLGVTENWRSQGHSVILYRVLPYVVD